MTHPNEIPESSAAQSDEHAPARILRPDEHTRADVLKVDEQAAATYLKAEEAQLLSAWVKAETDSEAVPHDAQRAERVRAIAKEIDDLVGNRQTLVADDLEERMIELLVGKLDPKSQMRLEISRDVAQVTAEKDHLEGDDLIRRLTAISARTLPLPGGAQVAADIAASSTPSNTLSTTAAREAAVNPAPAVAARARPIPRPSKIEPRKPGVLQRLFGRK